MMMGLGSVEIALAFWLSIGSAVLCVVYGIVNWNNKGAEPGRTVPEEDA
ncbi:MAG: symporter small accessory protein [Pseudomonadota bacterium]